MSEKYFKTLKKTLSLIIYYTSCLQVHGYKFTNKMKEIVKGLKVKNTSHNGIKLIKTFVAI